MTQTAAGISLFTPDDVDTWHQSEDREIYLGDVVDPSNTDTMSVGFARYAPGESNEWVVTYDEALIVTRGTYSVSSADGVETTAQAGEVIFLREGTQVVYSASDAGAEVVYVTYPHWVEAQQRSAHAALLETFHLVDGAPAPHAAAREEDNVALLRSIYGPLERGESHDFQAFFDHIADDVVFVLPVGELTGKEAVVEHFANGAELLEFNPFERPLEYIASGDRVVQLGEETFTVKGDGCLPSGRVGAGVRHPRRADHPDRRDAAPRGSRRCTGGSRIAGAISAGGRLTRRSVAPAPGSALALELCASRRRGCWR